jgi:SAM-dependent methyltransferase
VSVADRDKWDRRYREGAYAERIYPSDLLRAWAATVSPGRALDVACGAGRNALYLAELGFTVDAVDVSAAALERAQNASAQRGLRVNWIEHDLDDPLDLANSYQLILNIRYVDLPLMRKLAGRLAPGGLLICEQHLVTEDDVIGPRSPAFRVAPGELAALAEGLQLRYCREGLVAEPDGRRAALAQLVAQHRVRHPDRQAG